jgi:myo-inositol-1(or 4)-monophosphatase
MVTEAGGLVGNFSGDADFLEQKECMAGNPRVYGQMVTLFGKYSKFASAGEKATVRQSTETSEAAPASSIAANDTPSAAPETDAPF